MQRMRFGVCAARAPYAEDGYTFEVDRVKLGRALGYGTRHAAKTLAAVAEAAAAPGPRPPQGSRPAGTVPPRQTATAKAAAAVPRGTASPARNSARTPARSVWAPLATFSSALWLRVTGAFFALIAITMASGAWRTRVALRPGADPGSLRHFWLFLGFASLFGYFTVSSFLQARARERRGSSGVAPR